jgi:hypothetical protein
MAFESKELRKFYDAGKAISAAANVGLEQWARGVSGVVLKDWTANISVANPKRIEDRARGRTNLELGITRTQNPSFSGNPYQVSINTGGRRGKPGVVWTRNPVTKKWSIVGTSNNGSFTPANKHWKASVWSMMSAGASKFANLAPTLIERGRSASGLARQSVIQIADALGIGLEAVKGGAGLTGDAISRARSAIASDGKAYQNGRGTYTKTATSFQIEMTGAYSRNKEAKVAEALAVALAIQTVQFRSNAEKRVFESVQKTVQAYPYLSQT